MRDASRPLHAGHIDLLIDARDDNRAIVARIIDNRDTHAGRTRRLALDQACIDVRLDQISKQLLTKTILGNRTQYRHIRAKARGRDRLIATLAATHIVHS